MDPLPLEQVAAPLRTWIERDPIMRALFEGRISWADAQQAEDAEAAEAAEPLEAPLEGLKTATKN
jgi:hypothetical protein